MIKLVCFISTFLMSCDKQPYIHDSIIDDRVKACSAGFSNETGLSLHASLERASLNGDLSGNFKHETKSAIFSEMPESDRVKAYEDYIACIEKNWNITLKR